MFYHVLQNNPEMHQHLDLFIYFYVFSSEILIYYPFLK